MKPKLTPESVINTVPISLFTAIATAGAESL